MALRIAIAGAGRRGTDWAREVARAPGWQLVAVAEADDRHRAEAPDRLGIEAKQIFPSLERALDSCRCDAVIVCTPPTTRQEVCALAMSQGIALLVEKPFALDLSTAAGLVTTGYPIASFEPAGWTCGWRRSAGQSSAPLFEPVAPSSRRPCEVMQHGVCISISAVLTELPHMALQHKQEEGNKLAVPPANVSP